MKYGYFINPSPTSLSDLVNDHNYMVIRDYILDTSTLQGSNAISISDLTAGSVITKIAIKVETPFKSNNPVDTIEVVTDSNNILMDASWNDPAIGIKWPQLIGEYPGNADASGYKLEDGTVLNLSDKDQKWETLENTFKF